MLLPRVFRFREPRKRPQRPLLVPQRVQIEIARDVEIGHRGELLHRREGRLGNRHARFAPFGGRFVAGAQTRASVRIALDIDVHERGVVHDARGAILVAVRAIEPRDAFPVRRAGEADVAVAQAHGSHLAMAREPKPSREAPECELPDARRAVASRRGASRVTIRSARSHLLRGQLARSSVRHRRVRDRAPSIARDSPSRTPKPVRETHHLRALVSGASPLPSSPARDA